MNYLGLNIDFVVFLIDFLQPKYVKPSFALRNDLPLSKPKGFILSISPFSKNAELNI